MAAFMTGGCGRGFVGGGHFHDGRPGDARHRWQTATPGYTEDLYPQGLTAALAGELSREAVFDAMATRRTYATTGRRTYLEAIDDGDHLRVTAAAEDQLSEVALVRNGTDVERRGPTEEPRVVASRFSIEDLGPKEFCYIRATTASGEMAWSSPVWGRRK